MRWSDEAALFRVYGDPVAMALVGDGEPLALEECRRWIAVTHENYAKRGYGMLVVEDRETADVVGFCGLVHPGGQELPEAKYALAASSWGQGLATEALMGLLGWGHEVMAMPTIIATIHPEHGASQRVAHKAGMRATDPRREEDGTWTAVFVSQRGPRPPA